MALLERLRVVKRLHINDQTRVLIRNQRLAVDDLVLEEFDQEFIAKLDQAIKNYQLRLQLAIQLYICSR